MSWTKDSAPVIDVALSCSKRKAEVLETQRDTEKKQAAQEDFASFDTNDDGEKKTNEIFIQTTTYFGKVDLNRRVQHTFSTRAIPPVLPKGDFFFFFFTN